MEHLLIQWTEAEQKEKEQLKMQKQRRVGLGSADGPMMMEEPALESMAIPLATIEALRLILCAFSVAQDMQSVHRHLNDLRIATGAIA